MALSKATESLEVSDVLVIKTIWARFVTCECFPKYIMLNLCPTLLHQTKVQIIILLLTLIKAIMQLSLEDDKFISNLYITHKMILACFLGKYKWKCTDNVG